MPTRFSASGRPSRPATSLGSAAGSVLAFLIFFEIVSASSVRLMRERSDGSDFDIFLEPSRRLMMRAAGPPMTGSVMREEAIDGLLADLHLDADAELGDVRGKVVVEFLGDVAGQLQMLLLVLAHRHMRGAVDEDVGGHQARIGEQAERGVLAVLAGLVLELRHAVHPADARHAVEDPGKLGMLHHPALVEDDVLLRVDAGGEEGRGDRARLILEVIMHELRCQRMQVDHAIDAVGRVLQRDELLDRAEIVAEVEVARRLDAGEDKRLEAGHSFPCGLWRAV